MVQITPVHEPTEIQVGHQANYEYDLQATESLSAWDPDFCVSPEFVGGVHVDARAIVDGSTIEQQDYCLSAAPLSRTPGTFTFSLQGDSLGDVQLVIKTYGDETGELLGEHTTTVSVVGEGQGGGGGVTNPDDGSGDDDGGDDAQTALDELLNALGLDSVAEAGTTVKWAVIAVLALVTIYVLGTLFDIQLGGSSS